MNAPVLLLIFKRPDTTARVFAAIRSVRPARLYIAADGPRSGKPGEAQLCDEARRAATAVDWPCEVKTLFRKQNLGCHRAVSEAIGWFFENEAEGIILEDDTVPAADFFPYCEDLLERYRHEPRVMAIQGGSYFGHVSHDLIDSYAFCRAFDPWGWASWARAWKYYDEDFSRLDEVLSSMEFAFANKPHCPDIRQHWMQAFANTKRGKTDSWANRWTYTVFSQGGLVAYPKINLISNIGFRADATHTRVRFYQRRPAVAEKPLCRVSFPLKHPETISASEELEEHVYRDRFGVQTKRLYSRLLQYLGRGIHAS